MLVFCFLNRTLQMCSNNVNIKVLIGKSFRKPCVTWHFNMRKLTKLLLQKMMLYTPCPLTFIRHGNLNEQTKTNN